MTCLDKALPSLEMPEVAAQLNQFSQSVFIESLSAFLDAGRFRLSELGHRVDHHKNRYVNELTACKT